MSSKKKAEDRSRQIIKAAKEVFAEKGYNEATIAEIARVAGLSEPTLYEYFSSKEDILFKIPEETSQEIGQILRMHLEMIKGSANKLRGIIHSHFRLYQTDPQYAAVSFLILKQNRKFMETEAYNVLRRNLRPILEVIDEGIASGEFCDRFTPYFIRSVILGTMEHLTTRKLLMGTEDNLMDYVDSLLDLLLYGICPRPEASRMNFRVTVEPEGPAVDRQPRRRSSSPAKKESIVGRRRKEPV